MVGVNISSNLLELSSEDLADSHRLQGLESISDEWKLIEEIMSLAVSISHAASQFWWQLAFALCVKNYNAGTKRVGENLTPICPQDEFVLELHLGTSVTSSWLMSRLSSPCPDSQTNHFEACISHTLLSKTNWFNYLQLTPNQTTSSLVPPALKHIGL